MSMAEQAIDADRSEDHRARRRIAANFLTLAGTSVAGLLVTILVSVYVRRIMGPEAIGQVNWAMAVIGYLAVLATPGLAIVGQRDLARSPESTERRLSLVLTLQTLLAVAVYGGVLLFAWLEPRGRTTSLVLAVQGLNLFLTAWNITWVLQAHERMVAPSLATLAFNALQLPALLLLVDGPDDILAYVAIVLLCTLAGILWNVWYLTRRGIVRPAGLRPTLAGAIPMLREARPLALSQLAIAATLNSGTVLLGFTDGDEAVGQFASAYRLMLVAAVVTAALWNAYFPVLARSVDDPDKAVALSREYLGLLAWMGLPMAALGWALGRHVVALLYGPAFAESGHYFEWLCLNIGLTFLNYGIVAILVPWGRGDLQFRIVAGAAVLNVAVNALALPSFGAWGAVAATIASEFLALVLGVTVRHRMAAFRHGFVSVVAAPLLCSMAIAAAIVALPATLDAWWPLQLAVGAAALLGCLILFEDRTLKHRWLSPAAGNRGDG